MIPSTDQKKYIISSYLQLIEVFIIFYCWVFLKKSINIGRFLLFWWYLGLKSRTVVTPDSNIIHDFYFIIFYAF